MWRERLGNQLEVLAKLVHLVSQRIENVPEAFADAHLLVICV